MSTNPSEFFLWQSAIIDSTFRAANKDCIKGYTLTFGYNDGYVKVTFSSEDSSDVLDSQRLSDILSSGQESLSGYQFLREVQDVSVSERKVDQYGQSYFMIRMSPVEAEGPLYCSYPLKTGEVDQNLRKKL